MSSKFAGVTFDDQAATPSDDAIIRRAILADGILTGCEVSYTGSTLTMTAGQLMICGRQVKHPSTQNWAVADATTGFARLVLTIDLTRTSSKDTFEQVVDTVEYASAADGFADLVQEDINASGTKYQIVAAVVSLTTGGISGIVSQLGQTSAVMGEKSVIIVTAPTGSTVTCTKGTTVKTATEKNGEWWFRNLDLGEWTLKATLGDQSATTKFNIEKFGVYYVSMAYRPTPEFTYTGDYEVVDDNDQPIEDFANWNGNWKIRFLTSGTFTVTNMYGWDGKVDVFAVGGGAGGGQYVRGYSGGAGGYTNTNKNVSINAGTQYFITVGAGGATGTNGGNTSGFDLVANGGYAASLGDGTGAGGNGGNGGGGGGPNSNEVPRGGNGGSDGNDGGKGVALGGKGQISTPGPNGETGNTREFGDIGGTLYAGGGGGIGAISGKGGENGGGDGGSPSSPEQNGDPNTGGGGGGGGLGTSGGSGIVIIRNAREVA